MKNLFLKLFPVILILGVWSCIKEPATTLIPPLVFVPIYSPCFTETGVASAYKLTAAWEAGASCRSYFVSGKKKWLVEFTTCTNTNGSLREHIGIGGFLDGQQEGIYKIIPLASSYPEGTAAAVYGTLQDDGDVAEDYYYQDTTITNNYVIIDNWDTINKRVEGRFHLNFIIKEPIQNPLNPKKVSFGFGEFWAVIP